MSIEGIKLQERINVVALTRFHEAGGDLRSHLAMVCAELAPEWRYVIQEAPDGPAVMLMQSI